MTLSTTTLTGPLLMPDGTMTPFGAKVCFELSSYDTQNDEAMIVHGPVYADVDENGDFSIDLYTTANGEENTYYKMYVLWISDTFAKEFVNTTYNSFEKGNYTKKFIGTFSLAGNGPYRLDQISIQNENIESSFNVYQEVQAMAQSVATDHLDVVAKHAVVDAIGTTMASLRSVFEFDGAQSVDLTFAPISKDLIEVFFDGVLQHNSTYTLSDSTITFSDSYATSVEKIQVIAWGNSSIVSFEFGNVDGGTY